MPEDVPYQVDVIDPWEMMITPLEDVPGQATLELPQTELALRIRPVG